MKFDEEKLNGYTVYTHEDKEYHIDTDNNTCNCIGFSVHGYKKKDFKCKHIKTYLACKDFIRGISI